MQGINCNSGDLEVLDTLQEEKVIHRHRKCKSCGAKFYTTEQVVPSDKVAPLFTAWQRERSRKHRAKKKGLTYEPTITGANAPTVPKKPTSPLF